MAGSKDRDNPRASFMTAFAQLRTPVTIADSNPAVPIIDLSAEKSADANSIYLLPIILSGSGQITVELWMDVGGSLDGTYVKAATSAATSTADIIKFTGLRAAKYKTKVTNVGSGTWRLHESHQES